LPSAAIKAFSARVRADLLTISAISFSPKYVFMPSILAINAGSTSIKYKLFGVEKKDLKLIKEDGFDDVRNHEDAVKKILRKAGDLSDIKAVAHRVVHGGKKFIDPILADQRVLSELERISGLAPLHNPYNLTGIKLLSEYLPDIPQIAVFDTAFFSKLPAVARTYALPFDISESLGICRYGFHGTSHEYAAEEAAKRLGKDPKKANLITCHLGGGWSMAAIKKGEAVDASMGYTPMEGLVMLTRSGDIDPGIIFELIGKEIEEMKKSENYGAESAESAVQKVNEMLNRESGIKGLSGGGIDFKVILRSVSLGNQRAMLAFDIAIYRLVKYIGAYYAALEGKVDAIAFTGRIGAGHPMTRTAVMEKVRFLGKIPHYAIEPDEERMMARKARNLLGL